METAASVWIFRNIPSMYLQFTRQCIVTAINQARETTKLETLQRTMIGQKKFINRETRNAEFIEQCSNIKGFQNLVTM